MRSVTITLAVSTIAAAALIWFWVLPPFGFASYLSSTSASDIEIIRQYWPHRLIQPEWFAATPGQLDRLVKWQAAEGIARLSVVGALWLIVAGGTLWQLLRRQPNQALQTTPVTRSEI